MYEKIFRAAFKKAAAVLLIVCLLFCSRPVISFAKTASLSKLIRTTAIRSMKQRSVTKKSGYSKIPKSDKPVVTKDDLIYFGDCRTVGLAQTIYGYAAGSSTYSGYTSETICGAHCVAKVGESRRWAKNVGIYQVFSQLSRNPDAYVICNFGMNDINWYGKGKTTAAHEKIFAAEYVKIYQQITARYPKAHIVIMSVNPVISGGSKAGAQRDNTLIAAFNSSLKEAAAANGWTYLDTNSLDVFNLRSSYAGDGIHYTSTVYQALHKYVLEKLN